MAGERGLDIVVFGATGFVGRLVAGCLAESAPAGLRVGLAGRSPQRLAQVRAGLGPAAARWPLIAADSTDAASMAALAASTRVVATTVGPYARSGLPLVAACAAAGTDYADLTGEVLFMHDSIRAYDRPAATSRARIVHACGFDSIPSDLGVLLLADAARAAGAGDLEDTTLVVRALKGGISGGTVASGRGQAQELRADPARRQIAADPYALSPDRGQEPDLGDQREPRGVHFDLDLGVWVGPFVMGATNARVVRRSNAVGGWAYGRGLRYREVTGFGAGRAAAVRAAAMTAGQWAVLGALGVGPARPLLDRLLPSPGSGPGEATRRTGHFRMEITARTSTGARFVATVAARGDPGYAATSVMLAQSALCLALDAGRLPQRAGVLTPATAMGLVLVERLRAAGHTYDVAVG